MSTRSGGKNPTKRHTYAPASTLHQQDTNPLSIDVIHCLPSLQSSSSPSPPNPTFPSIPASRTLGLWPQASDHGLHRQRQLPALPGSAGLRFLDDHPLFLDAAAGGSSFFPAATTSQEPPLAPAPAASSSAARKPPRKRPRASRRPPTTVVTTDTSNFRAMVQEFTGIPAPPPHLGGPGGVLFGAPQHGDYPARAPFELLMRPSPLKLTAAPSASPPAGSFAHSLFANSGGGANPPGSSSESYGGFAPALSGAVVPRYDGGFDAAEDERVGHDHGGLFSSFLHAGDRYHHSH
ncbi:hypothetical protein U9M48_015932 [Paspalum notatum var. saurae]|uniref:VQ domain-containing protein n=1 Tax=Paspalum notatum var. saurae TaxID=547442 RepID=A0AAQ3T568_PASNO